MTGAPATRLTESAICSKDEATRQKTVNQYRLLSEIGKGTFCSKVKWAEDAEGRQFAVKVFSKGVLERRVVPYFDEHGATTVFLGERIQEELRLLSSISHRHIVALEEVIDDPQHGNLYVVLEGLAGGQLMVWGDQGAAYSVDSKPPELLRQHWGDAVLAGGSVADRRKGEVTVYREAVARHLVGQMLQAVAYLHEQGVIHKDLKPDNVLLSAPIPAADPRFARVLSLQAWPVATEVQASGPASGAGSVAAPSADIGSLLSTLPLMAKIGDFNTAAVRPQPDCLIYDAEGTQLFTPPECFQAHSEGVQGKARDMWSLGCVLFVTLFGRCPYWASENILLQFSIMEDPLTVPSGLVSAPVEDLIRSLLSKEPRGRPAAAAALRHAFLEGAQP